MSAPETRVCKTCSLKKYMSAYYLIEKLKSRYSNECKACTQSKASSINKERRKVSEKKPRGWFAIDVEVQNNILAAIEEGDSYKTIADKTGVSAAKLYGYCNAGHIPRAKRIAKNRPNDGVADS